VTGARVCAAGRVCDATSDVQSVTLNVRSGQSIPWWRGGAIGTGPIRQRRPTASVAFSHSLLTAAGRGGGPVNLHPFERPYSQPQSNQMLTNS
jgi:hypothetical protein